MHQQIRNARIGFSSIAIASWSLLVLLIFYTTPHAHGVWDVVVFYTLLFCALLGTVVPLELSIRQRFLARSPEIVKVSVRQALFASLLAVLLLILQSEGLLFWWVGGSLVLLFLCIEAFLNL